MYVSINSTSPKRSDGTTINKNRSQDHGVSINSTSPKRSDDLVAVGSDEEGYTVRFPLIPLLRREATQYEIWAGGGSQVSINSTSPKRSDKDYTTGIRATVLSFH